MVEDEEAVVVVDEDVDEEEEEAVELAFDELAALDDFFLLLVGRGRGEVGRLGIPGPEFLDRGPRALGPLPVVGAAGAGAGAGGPPPPLPPGSPGKGGPPMAAG